MTFRIDELEPGDVVLDTALGIHATMLALHVPHPLYPQLALVIWWMHEERRWSFDALHPQQELPASQHVRQPAPPDGWRTMRVRELRRVLFLEQRGE